MSARKHTRVFAQRAEALAEEAAAKLTPGSQEQGWRGGAAQDEAARLPVGAAAKGLGLRSQLLPGSGLG